VFDEKQSKVDTIRQAAESDRLLTAAGVGVPPDAMSRSSHDGVLERVIPGVYVGARHKQHALIEAAAWTLRYPNAVACLLTAATLHHLTDAFARGTWFYVAKGESRPRSTVVAVHVVQTAPKYIAPERDKQNGIITENVHGIDVRITGPDRTTLDLWRYPRRIAQEHALEALRRRVRAEDFHLPTFARLGTRLQIWSRVEPIVQGLVLR
jgi:predicted transcriptional regulator of viral defense system